MKQTGSNPNRVSRNKRRKKSKIFRWLQRVFMHYPAVLQFLWVVSIDRFLIVALLFSVLVIGITVSFIPKIWTTTPEDFNPVVKVSLLDRVQAWSLQRSAREYQAAGNFREAAYAWESALANDLANVAAHQGHLETLLELDDSFERRVVLLQTSVSWLAKLTQTNKSNLLLLARSLDAIDTPGVTLNVLEPVYDSTAPQLVTKIYGQALFESGRFNAYRVFFDGLPDELKSFDRFRLYSLALRATRSDLASSIQSQVELEAFAQDEDLKSLAMTLLFDIAVFHKDLDLVIKRRRDLKDAALLKPVHTHALVDLMIENEQIVAAAELLLLREEEELDGAETARRAELLYLVGEKELAEKLAEEGYQKFRLSPFFSHSYANYLIMSENWERLLLLASQVRVAVDQIFGEYINGSSYFWEGMALSKKGHPEQARRLFGKISAYSPEAGLALSMAAKIRQEGFPEEAHALYSSVQSGALETDFQYWFDRFLSAHASANAEDALFAAEKAYQIDSENVSAMANYCAALMFNETKLPLALTLAERVRGRIPGTSVAALNYGLALVMNARSAEALKHLKRIRKDVLTAEERTIYNLIFLWGCYCEKTIEGAATAFSEITPAYLLPQQREKLAFLADELGLVQPESETEEATEDSVLTKSQDFLR